MEPAAALAALEALGDARRAEEMAAYHKAPRRYLGVPVPEIDALTKEWRAGATVEDRVVLAAGLWDSDVHEARIAAARLLTQARIRPDAAVWDEICRWVPTFDAWAVADHACSAGARRLSAEPARLDRVEGWTRDPSMWVRRAALVMTLPWAKGRHPSEAEQAARERILGWAAAYVPDREWFIQKAIAWWLRTLSKHDPARVAAFLETHGGAMKPFAVREAGKYLR
ncbi:MAG: DNA alkylation repair protein [Pseudomonadota bacterium]